MVLGWPLTLDWAYAGRSYMTLTTEGQSSSSFSVDAWRDGTAAFASYAVVYITDIGVNFTTSAPSLSDVSEQAIAGIIQTRLAPVNPTCFDLPPPQSPSVDLDAGLNLLPQPAPSVTPSSSSSPDPLAGGGGGLMGVSASGVSDITASVVVVVAMVIGTLFLG
jgi:hypothetical protein